MNRRLPLLVWTLRTHLIGITGVVLGVPVLALLVASLYSEWRTTISGIELPPSLRGFLGEAGNYASPEGFLTAEFFSWVPAGLAIVAVTWGTAAIAGEEEAGRLELLLAQPVNRLRFLAETTAALALGLIVALLGAVPGLAAGLAISGVDVSLRRIALAVVAVVPLVLLFLALGLLSAAAFRNRAAATAAALTVLVAGYVLNLLGAGVDALGEARWASPFHWADASRALVGMPIRDRALVLAAVAVGIWGLAAVAFRGREIGGGAGWAGRAVRSLAARTRGSAGAGAR